MRNRDVIEFYRPGSHHHLAVVDSSMRLEVGDLISIRKKTWKVVFVSYAVDHADDVIASRMRQNVTLEEAPD
ncbi:MAG TPA: hypothetical protein VFE72_03015 [Lysobacter sp.]|nr:hypothetical protein [Lysobacter sp.]